MSTYFTADTHFNHYNIIRYNNRPFKTIDEMNSALIKNWNETVTNKDDIYFLGDFCFCRKDFTQFNLFLYSLNGRKYFLRGNHDTEECLISAENEGLITIIPNGYDLKIDHYPITLTHYPMLEYILNLFPY